MNILTDWIALIVEESRDSLVEKDHQLHGG